MYNCATASSWLAGFTFFSRFGHGKLYRHRDWSSKDYNFLPCAQGITKVTDKSGTNGVNISDQQENLSLESVTAPSDDQWTYSTIFTTQPQIAYPAIRLAQPNVPDETGYMKFRYQIRLTTQLELFVHLEDDFDLYNGDPKEASTSNMQQGRIAYNLPASPMYGERYYQWKEVTERKGTPTKATQDVPRAAKHPRTPHTCHTPVQTKRHTKGTSAPLHKTRQHHTTTVHTDTTTIQHRRRVMRIHCTETSIVKHIKTYHTARAVAGSGPVNAFTAGPKTKMAGNPLLTYTMKPYIWKIRK